MRLLLPPPRSSIHLIEAMRPNVSVAELAAIAEVLGVDPTKLFQRAMRRA